MFGMSEAGLMGAEIPPMTESTSGPTCISSRWSIRRPASRVPEGEIGTLCVTPLWTNHATPFLRWNSGDLVSFARDRRDAVRSPTFSR